MKGATPKLESLLVFKEIVDRPELGSLASLEDSRFLPSANVLSAATRPSEEQ